MTTGEDQLGADLLESDRAYFEWGAQVEQVRGGRIAFLPGLERIAAGCVVHRIVPSEIEDAGEWLNRIEERLRRIGCPRPRLYLDGPAPELEKALDARGYQRRVEVGLIVGNAGALPGAEVELREVRGEADWTSKGRFQQRCLMPPDGHATPPEDWVSMERRKCETGSMQAYLVHRDGATCGVVCAAVVGRLLRLKNIAVDPDWRRKGVGHGIIRRLAEMAASRRNTVGCYAVAGEVGEIFYQRAGMVPITRQIEWMRAVERS